MFKRVPLILSLCMILIITASCSVFYQKNTTVKAAAIKKEEPLNPIEKAIADNPEKDIKDLMKYFQKYYLNTWQYESLFMKLFANNENVSIIYPNALAEKDMSWAVGRDQIKSAFTRAFGFWESVNFNENTYQIIVNGNSAYLTANGQAKLIPEFEEKLRSFTKIIYTNMKLDNEAKFNKTILNVFEKVLLHDDGNNKDHNIPFVMSVFLIKESRQKVGQGEINRWKVQSMHFSIPVDLRAVKDIRLL